MRASGGEDERRRVEMYCIASLDPVGVNPVSASACTSLLLTFTYLQPPPTSSYSR